MLFFLFHFHGKLIVELLCIMYEAHSEMAWLRIPDAFVMLIQSYSTTTEIASKEKCVFRLVECCFTQAEIEAAKLDQAIGDRCILFVEHGRFDGRHHQLERGARFLRRVALDGISAAAAAAACR